MPPINSDSGLEHKYQITESSPMIMSSPLNGGAGFAGTSGRKTANACDTNAIEMSGVEHGSGHQSGRQSIRVHVVRGCTRAQIVYVLAGSTARNCTILPAGPGLSRTV